MRSDDVQSEIQQKPAERGYFLLNVAVGFLLLVGPFFVADFITKAVFPQSAEPRAYWYVTMLCLWPFYLFYRWAKPTGEPLWRDCLFTLLSMSGILAIFEIDLYFNTRHRFWMLIAVVAWNSVCNRARLPWRSMHRSATTETSP